MSETRPQEGGRRAVHLPPRIDTLMGHAFSRMKRRSTSLETPVPLPWDGVSRALGGGMWPGLYVVVGNTGSGKTQFTLGAAIHAAQQGIPVLYIALEGSGFDLVARTAGLLLEGQWSDLWLGRASVERIEEAERLCRQKLSDCPLYVEVGSPYGWHYKTLKTRAEAILAAHKRTLRNEEGLAVKPMLVVLDYLQLVGGEGDLRNRVGKAAYTAYEVAKSLNAVVMVVSSTAREHYKILSGARQTSAGKQPELGDGDPARLIGLGKESGEIEYGADGVLVLCQDKEKTVTQNWLAIAKRRAGKVKWIPMLFDGGQYRERSTRDDDDVVF